jgi:quercetin dioxygenase-like cupin family protein
MTAGCKPVHWDALEFEAVTEMVSRREISAGGQSLVQTYLRKGSIVPLHTHGGDQWITILQGSVALVVSGEKMTMREGEVLRIPAGAPHELQALDDTLVLDFRTGDVRFA